MTYISVLRCLVSPFLIIYTMRPLSTQYYTNFNDLLRTVPCMCIEIFCIMSSSVICSTFLAKNYLD